MRFVPSINLHQLPLLDRFRIWTLYTLQTDALILWCTDSVFPYTSVSYMFGSSLLTIWIFICEVDKNTAYLQLTSRRCTSSNSIISVILMDSFNISYGIYKLLSTALWKLWDDKKIKIYGYGYVIFNSSKFLSNSLLLLNLNL